ncbi:MAG: hypothetical protein IJ094_01915 [Bacilli bacterium]|nr:hypothetical protein [Bacilli bacterium]
MKDIYLTKKETEDEEGLKLLSPESQGYYGRVLKYKDGCVKLFFQNISHTNILRIERNIKIDSNIIMYPRCKVFSYEENKIIGYFMNIAPGTDFQTLCDNSFSKKDISFEYLLHIFYDKFIKDLKNEELMIYDMKPCQVFIDDNLYLTDTDLFRGEEDEYYMSNIGDFKAFRDVYSYNIDQINKVLAQAFYRCASNGDYYFKYPLFRDKTDENYIFKIINDIITATKGEVKTFGQLFTYKERK